MYICAVILTFIANYRYSFIIIVFQASHHISKKRVQTLYFVNVQYIVQSTDNS